MVSPNKNVFLLLGDDTYLKEKALKELSSSILGESSKHPDLKIFYGGDLDQEVVFDRLTTIPLLSDKRLTIIKDIQDAPDDFRVRKFVAAAQIGQGRRLDR